MWVLDRPDIRNRVSDADTIEAIEHSLLPSRRSEITDRSTTTSEWPRKYRRYRGLRRAYRAWARAVERYPALFAHWTQVRHPLLIRMAVAG
jgi:hypothetical protein